MLRKYNRIVVLSLLFCPVLLYLFAVIILTVDIPRGDDYDVFLSFLNKPSEVRFYYLFSQHNEHRLIFSRVVAIYMYQILGYIDFRYLTYIGNLALLVIFYIMYRLFTELNISLKYFLPVPYVLFFSRIWENMTWATGSLQNNYVVLFSILSLFFFQKEERITLVLSIFFAIAAASTSGSGILVFLVLILWSVFNLIDNVPVSNEIGFCISLKKNVHLNRFFIILFFSLIVFVLYFYNYTKPVNHPSVLAALLNPLNSLHYFFIFLGSYMPIISASFIGGIVMFSIFVYLTVKKYYQTSPVLYYIMVFVILNAAAAAATRSGFGIEQARSSKYVILSVLMLICLYFTAVRYINYSKFFNSKIQYLIFFILFGVTTAAFIVQTRWLSEKQDGLIAGANARDEAGLGLYYPNSRRAVEVLKQSSEQGIYQLPSSITQ